MKRLPRMPGRCGLSRTELLACSANQRPAAYSASSKRRRAKSKSWLRAGLPHIRLARSGVGMARGTLRSAVAPRAPVVRIDHRRARSSRCPMERVWSVDLPTRVGQKIVVAGWLHRLRRLSNVSFVILRDGRGLAQVVINDAALLEQVAALQPESVLKIYGEAVATEQAPGGVEVVAERVEVVSETSEPPPFELHRPHVPAQLPTILDHAALGLRHPRQRAIFRVAAAAAAGFRRTLRAEHFVEIFTPKLVGTATEGGANVFAVDYFGRRAFLAQSPQLYKQILVGVFERVFEVGPVFRAEPHDTPRHLNQYCSLDAELGFIEDHTSVMAVIERVIRGMLAEIQAEAGADLALAQCTLPDVPARVPVVDFVEAQQLIQAATGEVVVGELDLAPGHEI